MKPQTKFNNLLCIITLIVTCLFISSLSAEDITPEQAKAKLEDKNHLNRYFSQEFGGIGQLIGTDNDAAETKLKNLSKLINELEPETEGSKTLVERAKSAVGFYQQQIDYAKTPIDEIIQKLQENPDDKDTLGIYFTKQNMSLHRLVYSGETTKADKHLSEARDFVKKLQEKVKEETSKGILERGIKSFMKYDEALARNRQLDELVGKDAAPMTIEAWVNGDELKAEDLKGKVVLLDFWAVWCGPCIATFPHLKHLQETYGDQGLEIIGLTRYYNYKWNEKSKRAIKSQTPIAKTEEQKMLIEFAKFHGLNHRFAIQSDNSMSDYYLLKGIPHVVLLDKEGKIQMVKVGNNDQNAKDIEAKIKELL